MEKGKYYGRYDENGKWVTGQNGPNPMTAEEQELVDNWFMTYGPYNDGGALSFLLSKDYWKAVGKDLLFAIGFNRFG